MQPLIQEIQALCQQAFSQAFPQHDFGQQPVTVTQSTNAKFGDYQCNSAMGLAKALKMNPRQIADTVVPLIKGELISQVEVAGPGFINLTLNSDQLADELNSMQRDAHLGIHNPNPQTIVMDFSSPNIAKEMHVGHLRSTIIGDCIARVLEFLNNNVLRINHLGDWGTAFGMLIVYLKEHQPKVLSGEQATDLTHLVTWYKAAKQVFDENADFKKRAQLQVVSLQSGETDAIKAWQIICDISRQAFQKIYDLMDIRLTEKGESSYNEQLPEVVLELEKQELIEVSNGAKCIYMDGFKNREGEPLPFMIQKSDGGYNYATTDMAAIKHRAQVEKANRIIYVTDLGQALHFKMLYKAGKLARFYDPTITSPEHVGFGLVLGEDGKKFKTRSGETVRLQLLLDEAIERAETILKQRDVDWSSEEISHAAKVLGIGAVKYADLSSNRTSDYTFSFDRMLKFEGNTAAFILYSYVRTQSIKRKINVDEAELKDVQIELIEPAEIALGLHLRRFDETIEALARDLLPNHLTDYLFNLAQKFNAFFRDCHVAGDAKQNQRLLLCELTGTVLKMGLNLLGIETLERM